MPEAAFPNRERGNRKNENRKSDFDRPGRHGRVFCAAAAGRPGAGKFPGDGGRRKKKENNFRWVIVGCLVLLVLFFVSGRMLLHTIRSENALREALSSEYSEDPLLGAPPLDVELLTVNPYSRPGTPLEEVKNVAIHYTANPGSTAMNNRDYFEGLKDNHSNEVSSHFVIGLEGEIVQCIPTNEISYATNSRNVDTISIECCHPDETGQFNEATYQSLVELTAYLCNRFGLDIDHVIRH